MLNESRTLAALVALAQESRFRILRLLLRELPEGLPAGRIAGTAGCTPSTLSPHHGHPERVGRVRARRWAQSIIDAADPAALAGLVGFLRWDCCGAPARCLPVVADPAMCCPPPMPVEG